MTAHQQGSLRFRRIAAIGGGVVGVAALAGCTQASAETSTDSGASSGSGSSAASGSSGSSADLKDGSYSATGGYQSPGGAASVAVTLTLKDGVITKLKVEPKADDATSRQYEQQFASGVNAVAVGKSIVGLKVGAVSGSSLTSQGFEKALATIRDEAAA